jgi:hydroxymethylglutaryl-CoA lyase
VVLREVGPRDGLQAESPLPVPTRVALIDRLLDCGVTSIELCAFVSPTAVAAVGRRPGVERTALVPNARGASDALAAGVDALTVTVSASAAYNERNVRRTIDESLAEVASITALAAGPTVPVDVVVSCAFGSPYEGDIEPSVVAALVERIRALGAGAVTLADTTGMATPRRVSAVLDLVGIDVGLHLHDTRGTGLVNLYAGLLHGIRRFDTSVGGLGGSPFATGASGNVATEDVVALLDDLGYVSGIDLARLVDTASWLEAQIGHRLSSSVAYAGPRLPPA